MLNRVPADIPTPPKTFLCPLCQHRIGRKGLAGHLRNVHQIDKPNFFSIRPSRDMTPGRLGCSHCMSCFTTEAALKLHFNRATCPALLSRTCTLVLLTCHYSPSLRLSCLRVHSISLHRTLLTPLWDRPPFCPQVWPLWIADAK